MPEYTEKQGQYLAFIYNYTKINSRPPAEADMQRYFRTWSREPWRNIRKASNA